MSPVVVRPAFQSELAEIIQLISRAFRPWITVIGVEPAPLHDDYYSRLRQGELFVIGRPERLVAALVAEARPEFLLVETVAVLPERQGEGLGRAMMEFAEGLALEKGLRELRLYTHERMTSNIELYSKLGYEELEREDRGDRRVVWMRKWLGSRSGN